ncbi:MAG TPA: nucleotidyltransferase domain-containing protein [Candidatus Acidoferrum sp.]|nr:nucleotidyltransferase domain-containing protein [Candidatus Acidoferrum sp.]
MELPRPALSHFIEKIPYPLVFVTVSGAHLYGFPSADSDYDLRGMHVLPAKEVVGLDAGPETLQFSEIHHGLDGDIVSHDIKKFFGMLLKRNGYVLEQLTSPLRLRTSPEHEELLALVPALLTKHHSHHYLGFAQTEWNLFSKQPEKRVKPLLYVFRVLLTGIHLMQTGQVEANLPKLNDIFRLGYIPELIQRKIDGKEKALLAKADMGFYDSEFTRLLRKLEEAGAKTALPEAPSARPQLHDILLRLRLKDRP